MIDPGDKRNVCPSLFDQPLSDLLAAPILVRFFFEAGDWIRRAFSALSAA